MTTASRTEDDDRAELLLYMRPEEDLREHRLFRPWEGEYRLFRSPKVVKLEDHRAPGEHLGANPAAERGASCSLTNLISLFGLRRT